MRTLRMLIIAVVIAMAAAPAMAGGVIYRLNIYCSGVARYVLCRVAIGKCDAGVACYHRSVYIDVWLPVIEWV